MGLKVRIAKLGTPPKGDAPIGDDSDNNACAKTNAMPVNEIPPTPLYKRGASRGLSPIQATHLPPLLKGDRGGFSSVLVFSKITAVHSTLQAKLNYTTSTAGVFCKY